MSDEKEVAVVGVVSGVLFESHIADLVNLIRGSFKVVIGGTLSVLQGAEDYEEHGINQSFFRRISQRNDIALEHADAAYSIYSKYLKTVKPRPGALEWMAEQTHPVVFTHDVSLVDELLRRWNIPELQKRIEVRKLDENQDAVFYTKDRVVKNSKVIPRLVPEKVPPAPRKIHSLEKLDRLPLTARAWLNSCDPSDDANFPKQEMLGTVVHGLKRGSTKLGCPTANLDCPISFNNPSATISFPITGVYSGRCRLDLPDYADRVFHCVVNVGYCPHFGNTNSSLEVHIFHDFGTREFYGRKLALTITALIRVEGKYDDFEELLSAIQMDCEAGQEFS